MVEVPGISSGKAKAFKDAGYYNQHQLKQASQQELADVDGIGNALAARIKAHVGGY